MATSKITTAQSNPTSITYETYTKNDPIMWKYLMCKEKAEKEHEENV